MKQFLYLFCLFNAGCTLITGAFQPACGDGFLQAGETCDDGNTNNDDDCDQFCQSKLITCGNSQLDPTEVCDTTNLNGNDCTTISQGFTGGSLLCASSCLAFDTTNCFLCGDNITTAGEECDDGNNIDGDGCSAGCVTEVGVCGDGTDNNTEECDDGGTVSGDGCDATCRLEFCGDNLVQAGLGEACDGADLNGKNCGSFGFNEGSLSCTAECFFDKTQCATCGNNVVESFAGEQCDGINLGGQTCQSLGFFSGVLFCNNDCDFNNIGCSNCGNGTLQANEECDDGNQNNNDGCTNTCIFVNLTPVAVADSFLVLVGGQGIINVLDNDSLGNPQNIVTIVGGPNHGSASVNSNGSITYINNSIIAEQDTILYRLTDGDNQTSEASVFLFIQ